MHYVSEGPQKYVCRCGAVHRIYHLVFISFFHETSRIMKISLVFVWTKFLVL